MEAHHSCVGLSGLFRYGNFPSPSQSLQSIWAARKTFPTPPIALTNQSGFPADSVANACIVRIVIRVLFDFLRNTRTHSCTSIFWSMGYRSGTVGVPIFFQRINLDGFSPALWWFFLLALLNNSYKLFSDFFFVIFVIMPVFLPQKIPQAFFPICFIPSLSAAF